MDTRWTPMKKTKLHQVAINFNKYQEKSNMQIDYFNIFSGSAEWIEMKRRWEHRSHDIIIINEQTHKVYMPSPTLQSVVLLLLSLSFYLRLPNKYSMGLRISIQKNRIFLKNMTITNFSSFRFLITILLFRFLRRLLVRKRANKKKATRRNSYYQAGSFSPEYDCVHRTIVWVFDSWNGQQAETLFRVYRNSRVAINALHVITLLTNTSTVNFCFLLDYLLFYDVWSWMKEILFPK